MRVRVREKVCAHALMPRVKNAEYSRRGENLYGVQQDLAISKKRKKRKVIRKKRKKDK